ncbi:MAG: hypothetical protein NT121_11765 [Chloroflexi bacterium]|nr:hypothetical protein [Chloroflexota bacterium]
MKTTRFLIAILVLFSLIPQAFTAAPAVPAAPLPALQAHTPISLITLTVINNTGRTFSVVLEGTSKLGAAKRYWFSGNTGRSNFSLEPGVYVATFYGCARSASKKLQMQTGRVVKIQCGADKRPESAITIN